MIYKEDWEKCKDRFNAFWENAIIDRCCFGVVSPRKLPIEVNTKYREAASLKEKWLNPEFRYTNFIYELSKTYYGAEAFPNFWVNLGPGIVSAFVGSPYKLSNDTIWFDCDPMIDDLDKIPEIKFSLDSEMWKATNDITEFFCKKADGNYYVSMTDLGGTLDIVASFRGSQRLLMDLYDYPDEIKSLINAVDDVWINYYEKLQRHSNIYLEGTCGWLPVWCKERSYPIQCDISVMMSPMQFEEFVRPSLEKQSQFLDKCIYHLDGPGQLNHLDQILDIEGIDAIEWVPIPENGRWTTGDEKWFPIYKKIQAKGKKLVLRDVEPNSVERLLKNISSKGLFFTTYTNSEDEAKEMIKKVEQWSI